MNNAAGLVFDKLNSDIQSMLIMILRFLTLITFFTFFSFQSYSQNEPGDLSVSFLLNNGLQPGFKLGTHIPLKIKLSDRSNDPESPNHRLYLQPQFGLFSDIDRDMNYFIGGEIGKIFDGKNDQNNQSLGIQAGYLRQSIKESFGVNLGSGNFENEMRAGRNFFFTGLAFSHRWMTKKKKRLWTKVTMGRKIRQIEKGSFLFQVEFGTTINFKVSENE